MTRRRRESETKKSRCRIKTCPTCSEDLNLRRQAKPRLSTKARLFFVASLVFTFLWFGVWYLFIPGVLVPLNLGGIALCAVVYTAPGLILAGLAAREPRIRTLCCSHCGWTETVEMGDGTRPGVFDFMFDA